MESSATTYFMFGRADCAAPRRNGFALWLDEEVLRGNSAPSETFDNPCLSGGVKDFQIVYVELWTFADAAWRRRGKGEKAGERRRVAPPANDVAV